MAEMVLNRVVHGYLAVAAVLALLAEMRVLILLVLAAMVCLVQLVVLPLFMALAVAALRIPQAERLEPAAVLA